MRKKINLLLAMLLFLPGCRESSAQIMIETAFPNLSFENPVDIQHPGDGTNRLFVVEQPGKIYVFGNSPATSVKKLFLDITSKVLFGGEQGLLGLAFHPDYKNNGYFFVNYVANNPRRTVISRFKVSATNADAADRNSELVLMEINQPYSNHNGGQTTFGPDGYLYISLGDGGSAGDPQNNAQNLRSLLGKILRIDVNKTSGGLNYSIPDDNPFKGNTNGLREEIYAWGLRNVWRFSFDKVTGKMWGADVGQNAWEEIDIIEKGKNYGWRIMEGNHCYNPPTGCNTTNLTLPVWEYGHNSEGGYSITGGFVYRGKNAQELYGKYIYGDFVTGNLWALEYDGTKTKNTLIVKTNRAISTFGVDQYNELYFADYNSGRIYKFNGTPTSSRTGSVEKPGGFKLYQNFPNPFSIESGADFGGSRATQISFTIPETGYVSLKIYDLLGREVAAIVDEFRQAGNYTAFLESGKFNLASGIYFYTIKVTPGSAGGSSFSETKKMVLAR